VLNNGTISLEHMVISVREIYNLEDKLKMDGNYVALQLTQRLKLLTQCAKFVKTLVVINGLMKLAVWEMTMFGHGTRHSSHTTYLQDWVLDALHQVPNHLEELRYAVLNDDSDT